MDRQQKIDNIAILVMTILGVIFFAVATTAFKNIDVECPSKTIRNGWTVILTLGACMVVSGISFFACTLFSGADCYHHSTSIRTLDVYFGFFLILGLFMVGMCSAMLDKYNKLSSTDLKSCDDGTSNKKKAIMILVFSLLIVLFSSGILVKIHLSDKEPEMAQGEAPGLQGIFQ